MRALAFEGQHGVDHVLDHARAGDLAVLGDMADQDDGGARALGEADQRLRAAPRTWVTVPGADSTASVHMVWIESMIDEARRSRLATTSR